MEEIWKDVVWYEGLYQISNIGNVRSSRWLRKVYNWRYKQLYLSSDWKNKMTKVHRLVAEAFIPNNENKRCVNHKNGNKHDNRIDNLERATSSENNTHAYRELWIIPSSKGKFWKDSHRAKKIIQKTLDWILVRSWDSTVQVQESLWFSRGNISSCCNGSRQTAYWYKREFV